MNFIVPPGGFAGFSQMTAASRAALAPSGSRGTTTRRRRKTAKKAGGARGRRTAKKPKKSGRKMKFGSPAWRKKYGLGKKKKK